MRRATDLPEEIYNRRHLEHERELALALWELADYKKIGFVSFDLEGPYEAITELGLAFQRKNDSRREGRHIIVKSNQHKKVNPPKPCGFGLSSEEVDKPEELYTILNDVFTHQHAQNHRVVLTGFDIKTDLARLHRDCRWKPPTYVTLVDAATVFKALSGKNSNPNVATALEILGFARDPRAPFHNAANDAWYALEVLFRKAEQARLQHEDPEGDGTIVWLVPTRTPPLSPVVDHSDGALGVTATLSTPFDINPPSYAPNLPSRPVNLPPRPDFPLRPNLPPRPDLPPKPTFTAGMPALPPWRKRRRSQRDGLSETIDTTDATPSVTPVDSRPKKRQKLMEASLSNG